MKAIKQYAISLFAVLALLFGATTVFAQDETSTDVETEASLTTDEETSVKSETNTETSVSTDTNDEDRDAARKDRLEERDQRTTDRRDPVKENVAERETRVVERQAAVAERREALSERTKERITNLTANISNRLDAAVARMQNIVDRINTRIEKLADRGLDTTEAETHMNDAQDALDAAKIQLANIDVVVQVAITAEDPRAAWQNAKAEYLAIKELIKSAHTSLREAVASLKAAVAAGTDDETSEPTTPIVESTTTVEADAE